MGCGCGGVKRSAERVPREQVVGGSQHGGDPGGFKWNGPQRAPQPKPVEAETEAEPVPSAD